MLPAMTSHSGRSIVVIMALALLPIAGCHLIRAATPAIAQPCVAVYSAERCDAMLTVAAEQLGIADAEVTALEIAPDPTPRSDGILEVRGGARGIVVLVHVGNRVREVPMCMGLPSGPACGATPILAIGTPIGAGYEDVPCAGEPPDGCATPVPSREPSAAEAARPLRIDHRVIAIAGVGPHEVSLGTATIPNGVLTVAQAELVDPWPDGVRLSSQGIRLEVRSLVAGRPAFNNIHEHGWWPGTEAVEVFLVFEVRRVQQGATIEIQGVLVG